MKHTSSFESEIQKAFANLQLPHNTVDPSVNPSGLPTLRVLVVADVDLNAASALAEYTIQQKNKVFDASRIDLIIACGSFCRDDDLRPYLVGKQRQEARRRSQQQQKQSQTNSSLKSSSTPFFRSREDTAALEGLFTAALSQLESIVCRVVYCPGATDPLTTIVSDRPNRLTPNSRNVHQQWMPIAPGLGCAALLYFEAPERVLNSHPVLRNLAKSKNYEDDNGEDWTENETEIDEMAYLAQRLVGVQESSPGFCSTLERLLHLGPAPPSHAPLEFHTLQSQSILVTHYVDLDDKKNDADCDTSTTTKEAPLPWPRDHASFCTANDSLLCLEIASGSSPQHPARLIRQGTVPILLPGSLRERGEFCLLDLSLSERRHQASERRFAWKVNNVNFHRVQRYP